MDGKDFIQKKQTTMGKPVIQIQQGIQKISREKLLKLYNPSNCIENSNKLKTIEDAIGSKAPSIGALQRDNGKKFTQGLVNVWLIYLNEMLNLNKPMSESQVKLCSGMILDEFYALKISDLTILFKRIISGEYGEFYERLSIDKVMSFFRKYFNERCVQAEETNYRKHQEYKLD